MQYISATCVPLSLWPKMYSSRRKVAGASSQVPKQTVVDLRSSENLKVASSFILGSLSNRYPRYLARFESTVKAKMRVIRYQIGPKKSGLPLISSPRLPTGTTDSLILCAITSWSKSK